MNDLENYIKVNMNLHLEEPNTHHSEIELVKALCFAFNFRYKALSPNADILLVEIYFLPILAQLLRLLHYNETIIY